MFGRRGPAGAGDSAADEFAGEALEHLDALYRSALRLARRPDQAQDLVQDTYLKALRARARFEPGTNLKAWLHTILHNTWRNRRRDGARDRVDYDSAVVEAAGGSAGAWGQRGLSPEALLMGESLDADLQAALEAVPEPFREVVWLRDVEELTYQEIAGALAIPIGTVMSRLSRGRKRLYDALTTQRERK